MQIAHNPIATFVRTLMADNHWTQEVLADQLGISRPNISHWLKGRTMPEDRTLEKMARMAGVDPEHLIRLKQEVKLAQKGYAIEFRKGDVLNPDEQEVIRLMRDGDHGAAITLLASKMKRSAA